MDIFLIVVAVIAGTMWLVVVSIIVALGKASGAGYNPLNGLLELLNRKDKDK